jgi:hypothetical protein
MSRPVPNTIAQGIEGWDAAVTDNFSLCFNEPIPIYSVSLVSLPAANVYDGCLAHDLDSGQLVLSDGTNWKALASRYDSVTAKTNADSPYTALVLDDTLLCDASSGAITINLYATSGTSGLKLNIKKTDSSVNAITIDGDTTETIDGSLTKVISTQYDSITIQSDGSNWHII